MPAILHFGEVGRMGKGWEGLGEQGDREVRLVWASRELPAAPAGGGLP